METLAAKVAMPRDELIQQIAEYLEPWAWEVTSYNATVARDEAREKAEQIVAIFHPDRLLLEALRTICEEDVTSTEMVQIASAALRMQNTALRALKMSELRND